MTKRIVCNRCGSKNEYEPSVQQDVRCKLCGHHLSYGFHPEYVTEVRVDPQDEGTSFEAIDDPAIALAACERLARHVVRYTEYLDRDRDILLLHMIAMMDRLDSELASIKRMVDVIAKRTPAR